MYDVRCPACGQEQIDVLCAVAAVVPCPGCGQPTERVWRGRGAGVNGDEIPGGVLQENGFHQPQRFYSKSALREALAAQGKELKVRHMPLPGTDKSPFTTDWSKGSIDPYTLAAAASLAARNGGGTGHDPAPEPIPIRWQVRDVDARTGAGPWRDVEPR